MSIMIYIDCTQLQTGGSLGEDDTYLKPNCLFI